ncbi:riboflavin kinase [uncultured Bifidobacterium sp.]|uniref:riboflavin kinase n=1 Tax=uncultured Bifidobacterium sp. TaxID=165187 RepID=UPI0028DC15B0|nr:riboflavin kinase [uncultured Bifidobacterium sp.]
MIVTRLTPDAQGDVDWPTLSADRRSVLTVGVFDGMHRGHRTVVRRVVELARRENALSVIVMFDPRPGLVHRYAASHGGAEPEASTPDAELLTSVPQRLKVMEDLGVDHVLVVRYTLAFASRSYRFFLGRMVGRLGMRHLVLGADAAMGAGRAGTVEAIAALADATRVFELDVVDDRGPGCVRVPSDAVPARDGGDGEPQDPTQGMTRAELRSWSKRHQARLVRVWSSSNVRYLLSQGRVREATSILGAVHGIEAEVVHGEQRGRTLGFPTANLAPDIEGYLPADGVYAGWLVDEGPVSTSEGGPTEEPDESVKRVVLGTESSVAQGVDASDVPVPVGSRDASRRWPSAISIGTKPTYSSLTGLHDRVVEAYAITDEWLHLYGHRVRVEFVAYLHPQIRYASSEELRRALDEYVRRTRGIVGADASPRPTSSR